MRFSERFLLFLTRKPGSSDFETSDNKQNLENALSLLCRVFPNFLTNICCQTVVDFGCGKGFQSVAMAITGAKYVLGFDTNVGAVKEARHMVQKYHLDGRVEFTDKLQNKFGGKFDVVISQNSMEHFRDPVVALNEMK
ncbi:MAG: methyltransferase domain-containing protein [Deltaproteobacteria bacterium]|nr:methyltransferase domain-containing protein [Deltaproteobacteria bacterium]